LAKLCTEIDYKGKQADLLKFINELLRCSTFFSSI